jgi:uncharacterized protein
MQSIPLTIKRALWLIFLCVAIASVPLPSLAVTVKEVPNPQQVYGGWVTDMANLFDCKTQATLNQKISKLEAENGTEIAVVTVPETTPAPTPKQFATKLFNYWGIGKKGIDNGVLFLISKGDHRVEIETGYGIEKRLPNARVGNIIDQLIIPHFKQDDFAGGTLAGIQALIKALERRDIPPITSKPQLNDQTWIVILGMLILSFLGLCGFLIGWSILNDNGENERRRMLNRRGSNSSSNGGGSWSSDGSGSWSSDGGGSWGGGDSGGFGGGDSGGGGDGGSW